MPGQVTAGFAVERGVRRGALPDPRAAWDILEREVRAEVGRLRRAAIPVAGRFGRGDFDRLPAVELLGATRSLIADTEGLARRAAFAVGLAL